MLGTVRVSYACGCTVSQHHLFYFIYKFIYYLFLAALGLCCCTWLSLVASSGGYPSLRSSGSRRMGFSTCGSWALECRLSSCDAWAQLLRGTWDPPGPGLKRVSPALAGRFLTTAPPGKPPTPFIEETILSPLYILSSFVVS